MSHETNKQEWKNPKHTEQEIYVRSQRIYGRKKEVEAIRRRVYI